MSDLLKQFEPGVPIQISPLVRRVTAYNAGVMTGPGTNTYLIGTGDDITVIDPGPDEGRHVQNIVDACGGKITRIAVTHTHPDHSPGCRLLKKLTGAEVCGHPSEIQGGGHDASFKLERPLLDGDVLQGRGYQLRCVHTPGHASNHICYLLESDGLLFTGDHIMGGSTVVIAPPDGDMAEYLSSLEKLKTYDIKSLAPGHGLVYDNPYAIIDWLIDHRLQREAKIFDALGSTDAASIPEIVKAVYTDVAEHLHVPAAWSVYAHLIKLAAEAKVVGDGFDGIWRTTESPSK